MNSLEYYSNHFSIFWFQVSLKMMNFPFNWQYEPCITAFLCDFLFYFLVLLLGSFVILGIYPKKKKGFVILLAIFKLFLCVLRFAQLLPTRHLA